MLCPILNAPSTVYPDAGATRSHWHQLDGKQADSVVPVIGLQHFVPQSSFFSHFGLHANAPLASKLVQANPSQQCRAPPQAPSAPEQEQAAESAQNPSAAFA
jgi:hypothetical protein